MEKRNLLPYLLPFFPLTGRDPPRFPLHHVTAQPCVALRDDDGRVPQEVLERCQATAALYPLTRERMTELVDVKTLQSGATSYDVCKRSWRLP